MPTLPRRAALLLPFTLPAAARAAAADRRILVFGDSQAQGLAAAFLRTFRTDRATRVLDRSKIGTGLSRPAFDWVAQARALANPEKPGEKPGVAIAMFGANDRPPPTAGADSQENRLQAFMDDYAAKVTAIAAIFREAGIPLFWVGHPVVRDDAYADDMAVLNDIIAGAVTPEGATFVSTWDMFRGPDGHYAAYGTGPDGQTTRLRADDGVHLTPAGYDMLAAFLLPDVERALAGLGG